MKKLSILVGAGALLISLAVLADQVTVKMYKTAQKGKGAYIGQIKFRDTKEGLLVRPHLFQLPPGVHGIHVHAKPSCADMGLAAEGHYDPNNTGKHLGPFKKGHLGDLPRLHVAKNSKAYLPMLAPHLKVQDLKNHAIIIHADGDNYSDEPKPLGGGGARIACGVVK